MHVLFESCTIVCDSLNDRLLGKMANGGMKSDKKYLKVKTTVFYLWSFMLFLPVISLKTKLIYFICYLHTTTAIVLVIQKSLILKKNNGDNAIETVNWGC